MSCPDCLDPAEFQGHRPKTFTSLVGPIRPTQRPYYHCPRCHAGSCCGDLLLGLEHSGLTPAAQQIVTLGGTLSSFAVAAAKILPKMTGLRLGESTVERTTEGAGVRLGEQLARGDTFGPPVEWDWHEDATGQTCAYVSIDATGVGQQGPHGAKADGRMVAVGMVYNPLPPDLDNPSEPRPPRPHAVSNARYLAGLYDLDGLGSQLSRQSHHGNISAADQVIGLTDGGNGLEACLLRHYPDAKLILDFWHPAGHVSDLAEAYGGPDPAAGRLLGEQWCHELKHEGGEVLLATLKGLDLKGAPAETVEAHRRVTQYIGNNVHRMDYPGYRARGWQIGSGSVESACKTVINKRLNDTGMRWGTEGTDSVSHLRALFLSEEGQWDAFWAPSRN